MRRKRESAESAATGKETGVLPQAAGKSRALRQAVVFAAVLVLLAVYLWGFRGIRTVDMQNMPKPMQYWNTTLTSQDQLTQQFSSDDPSMRGVEVYPLFTIFPGYPIYSGYPIYPEYPGYPGCPG